MQTNMFAFHAIKTNHLLYGFRPRVENKVKWMAVFTANMTEEKAPDTKMSI